MAQTLIIIWLHIIGIYLYLRFEAIDEKLNYIIEWIDDDPEDDEEEDMPDDVEQKPMLKKAS